VGRESDETVTTVFVSRLLTCTGGNEAYDVSARNSIVETVRSIREEPEAEHHKHVEKAHDSKELLDCGLRALRGFGYLRKNTNIIHKILHSLPFFFTFRIYIKYISFNLSF
jgi:hypothetical protein